MYTVEVQAAEVHRILSLGLARGLSARARREAIGRVVHMHHAIKKTTVGLFSFLA